MKKEEINVHVNVVKNWVNGFVPTNIYEKEFKEKVENILIRFQNGNLSQTFTLAKIDTDQFQIVNSDVWYMHEAYLIATGAKKIYSPFEKISPEELFEPVIKYFQD